MKKFFFIVSVVLMLGFLWLPAAGWVFHKAAPKVYRSYAYVLIDKQDLNESHDNSFARDSGTGFQLEVIKSKIILYPVFEALKIKEDMIKKSDVTNLTNDEIYQNFLCQNLRVKMFRQSLNLAEIAVEHDNPQRAADIANAIAEQYVKSRKSNDSYTATIINRAEPNPRPVKPKTRLIMLAAVGAGTVSLLAGVGLLFVVRRKK